MQHPAFSEAGTSPGMEIWTIDKFEPVPIEKNMYGNFFSGDSYIILKTYGDENKLNYDAHFWIGSHTSQDEKGAAAILTVTLDDMLGGRAIQHREVQGHESSRFLGYFKPAIRYLEGGLESGFKEVETNAGADKRLLRLSGNDNMRIDTVPAEAPSLSKDHCYILEVEHDIFVLMPEGAKATHRRKIISYATKLRDDNHNGRATIEIIDEFSSDDDVALFFEALGSGSMEGIATFSTEAKTYQREGNSIFLYKVIICDDDIRLAALNKPHKQKHLSSAEVYILDTPTSGIFIWIGKDVDSDTKKNYNDIAQKYLDLKEYPSWVHVTRVSESAECSTFKQFFQNWDTLASSGFNSFMSDVDAGYYSGDAEEIAASAKLIGKSATARGYMPDEGDGQLTVFRVDSGELEDCTERFQSGYSVLYQSDVYIIKYKYETNDGDCFVLYYWIGSDANNADKMAATRLVNKLDDELEGNTTVVKVPQGKESKHFLTIFKGNLIVLFGGKTNDFMATNANNSYEDDGIRLFKIEGTAIGSDMRGVQVKEAADSLEDDDVFVLETKGRIFIWHGKESDDKEQEAGLSFVKLVANDVGNIITIEQGEETDDFWDALGGSVEEREDNSGWRNVISRRVNAERTLVDVSVDLRGDVAFESLADAYAQEDLSDDGVYILDVGEEIYLWWGNNTPERVRSAKSKIIEEYLKDDGFDRTVDSAIVVKIKQGHEPKVFQKLFPNWDHDMWNNQSSYEDLKSETKSANSK